MIFTNRLSIVFWVTWALEIPARTKWLLSRAGWKWSYSSSLQGIYLIYNMTQRHPFAFLCISLSLWVTSSVCLKSSVDKLAETLFKYGFWFWRSGVSETISGILPCNTQISCPGFILRVKYTSNGEPHFSSVLRNEPHWVSRHWGNVC